MQTPHNGPTMRVCLDGVLSSEVYYRAHRCGRRRFLFFFFFNRQPVTLFEFYCSFLRVGTGLEMEAEFMNPELKGGGYCMLVTDRNKNSVRDWIQSAGGVSTNTLANTTQCAGSGRLF